MVGFLINKVGSTLRRCCTDWLCKQRTVDWSEFTLIFEASNKRLKLRLVTLGQNFKVLLQQPQTKALDLIILTQIYRLQIIAMMKS